MYEMTSATVSIYLTPQYLKQLFCKWYTGIVSVRD